MAPSATGAPGDDEHDAAVQIAKSVLNGGRVIDDQTSNCE
jgi:hypothetical protein